MGYVYVRVNVAPSDKAGADGTPLWRLHLVVEDSGIGLAPSAMSKLFKPYSQADKTTSRDFGGTGKFFERLQVAVKLNQIIRLGFVNFANSKCVTRRRHVG